MTFKVGVRAPTRGLAASARAPLSRMTSTQDFVCRIPLKPTNDPPKEDEVRRLLMNPKFKLVDEFAVRYLESIGAAPTPANIRMVKAEIPVKRSNFTIVANLDS